MAELLADLPDCEASDRVRTGTDLSELEPPSKKRKTGKFSSENERGADDGSRNDHRRILAKAEIISTLLMFRALLDSLSSENEGGVDDSRSNDDGRMSHLSKLVSADDSRSNDDGWMGEDSHELGQLALFPMELEPPFSGKSSSENEGRLDDRRSNDGGLSSDNFVSMWVESCEITDPGDWLYSNNKGGVNDSRSNGDGWMPDDPRELGQLTLFPMELEPPFSGKSSSENEGRLDDRRSNDGGLSSDNFELMWSELCEITDLGDWLYSKNKGRVNDSRSNGDGWMPDDPHELGQPALVPMELEPPFSGKESNEIDGVEGSCEVHPVAGKCPVRHPSAVQLLSADVNLRMEGRHPRPLLLWSRHRVLKPFHSYHVGTIFGNLKDDNVLRTDQSFSTRLSYIKKNNMDLSLAESAPEAEDLSSHLLKKNWELRPGEVLLRPFFWNSKQKMRFLLRINDRLQLRDPAPDPNLLEELKSNEPPVFNGNWIDKIDPKFKANILQRGDKYDYSSITELLRFMRNKYVHFLELPRKIKKILGWTDESFHDYFAARFPRLLMNSYGAASQFCREERWFKELHGSEVAMPSDPLAAW